MNDAVDEVYINTINHIPQVYQRTGLGLESGVSVLGSSDEKGAPTFNSGNQCDGQDSQARLGGAGRAVSEVDLCDLLDEEDIDLQVSGLGLIWGSADSFGAIEHARYRGVEGGRRTGNIIGAVSSFSSWRES